MFVFQCRVLQKAGIKSTIENRVWWEVQMLDYPALNRAENFYQFPAVSARRGQFPASSQETFPVLSALTPFTLLRGAAAEKNARCWLPRSAAKKQHCFPKFSSKRCNMYRAIILKYGIICIFPIPCPESRPLSGSICNYINCRKCENLCHRERRPGFRLCVDRVRAAYKSLEIIHCFFIAEQDT